MKSNQKLPLAEATSSAEANICVKYICCEGRPAHHLTYVLSLQAKPHMLKSEVVDNETGKSAPSECVNAPNAPTCSLRQS